MAILALGKQSQCLCVSFHKESVEKKRHHAKAKGGENKILQDNDMDRGDKWNGRVVVLLVNEAA